jgi:hypothetical protein
MMAMRVFVGSFVGIISRARRVVLSKEAALAPAGRLGLDRAWLWGTADAGASTEASEKRQRNERIE